MYIQFKNIMKVYNSGENEIKALNGLDMEFAPEEFALLLGASGSGKSTALNLLGGIDRATSGELLVGGSDIAKFSDKQLTRYRREKIGFIFQFYNLIPNLTALENVELASQICKSPLSAKQVLTDVGLGERLKNFPAQLSGGEQQRVAIARALAKNPDILLCDEPTGALDFSTGRAVLRLLYDMGKKNRKTVIVVTHNTALTPMADRVISIRDGRVHHVETNAHPKPADEIEW